MIGLFSSSVLICLFAFAGIFFVLYILTIAWTIKDGIARGANWKIWLVIAILLPFLGALIYCLMRPSLLLIDKEEQELDITLKSRMLSKYGNCANCGFPVTDEFAFCPNCQKQLKAICSHCGKAIELEWEICPYCGTFAGASQAFATNKNQNKVKTNFAKANTAPDKSSSKNQSSKSIVHKSSKTTSVYKDNIQEHSSNNTNQNIKSVKDIKPEEDTKSTSNTKLKQDTKFSTAKKPVQDIKSTTDNKSSQGIKSTIDTKLSQDRKLTTNSKPAQNAISTNASTNKQASNNTASTKK